ncbi:MAG: hypothetical protein JWM11_1328, partial [Planctomycetaceae bacterium]|nr:hypothetical protein [Planctomycetaceae bacterium]
MTGPNLTVALQKCIPRSVVVRFVLVIGLFAAMLSSGLADEPDPAYRAARAEFNKQFRRKAPGERIQAAEAQIQAIEAIQEFPSMEVVNLLIKGALFDRPPEVNLAARKAMQKMAQDPATAKALVDEIKKYLKRKSPATPKSVTGPLPAEIVPVLLQAAAATSDVAVQEEFLKTLDDFLESANGTLLLPITVIDDCALQNDKYALQAITLFSKSKMFDQKFGYQRCIVQAMSKLKQKDAVKFLIDMIPKAEGLIQYDVVFYLSKLTNQDFREDHRQWVEWWAENKDEFEFPKELPIVTDEELLTGPGDPAPAPARKPKSAVAVKPKAPPAAKPKPMEIDKPKTGDTEGSEEPKTAKSGK